MLFDTRTFYASLAWTLGCVSAYTEQALLDQVVDLPGTDGLDIQFNQFSGYLQVESGGLNNMHYWFVESMHVDPAEAPVAFWTNGKVSSCQTKHTSNVSLIVKEGRGAVACWGS